MPIQIPDACPFCGGHKLDYDKAGPYSRHYFIYCMECEARGPTTTEDNAILVWNTRIRPPN